MNRNGNAEVKGFKKHLFAALNVVLVLALALSLITFATSYKELRNSIQSERADSVKQISTLISDRVSRLRETYVNEISQTAQIITSAPVDTLADLEKLLANSARLVLVDEKGNYCAPDGSTPLINDSELLTGLLAGEDVSTSFATIQTKGDYWLFAKQLHDVTIDGVPYIGVVLTVSAQEYADVATISLYDRLGESLVVAGDGTIKMRPSQTGTTDTFGGYNILTTLQKSDMTQAEKDVFTQALKGQTEYSFSCTLDGMTWLVQSVPADSGRNIVVVVPVSLTAQSTYRGMATTLAHIAVSIVLLALLFIFDFTTILRKNQRIEVEHARARSKSDFLDKMSHDIRTPLNAIVGMHALALQSIDDKATVYDCLIKAKRSSDYLVSVINDVLDMSRIESGKMTLAHKQFDLRELLDGVVQIESVAAAEKDIALSINTLSDIDTDFVGDAQRLRQCLMNLVNNAVKFTPRGGRITITYRGETGENGRTTAVFSVEDTGIGMSEEFMQKLFKPFEQEQNSLYNAYAGSGLGLSIVYDFVALMGGNITAKSKKGEGSTFIITIPLETAPKAEKKDEVATDEELAALLKGRRVLLVEDNAINRQIISMLLEKMGLDVEEAENGQIAVEKYTAAPAGTYSLILMDIMMPVMGGLEATAAIRKMNRADAGSIPIVALSANAFEEDARKSLDAGMQMHLAKPVDVEELKRVLKKYIR